MANKKKEIVLACFDDWEGLYIDGKLVVEDHSITLESFARHAGVNLSEKQVNYDWMQYRSRFPENLSEVKFTE